MSIKQINIDMLGDEEPKERRTPTKLEQWISDKWDSIHYTIWRKPKRIISNFWYFRKEIADFHGWDYNYNFNLFIKSLEKTANTIESNDIIVDAKETADSIRKFCNLYKRYIEDNYIEEAGCNWDNVKMKFVPIPGDENLRELKYERDYTEEEWKEFREKSNELRQKDFDEMIEEFKKFETWWD